MDEACRVPPRPAEYPTDGDGLTFPTIGRYITVVCIVQRMLMSRPTRPAESAEYPTDVDHRRYIFCKIKEETKAEESNGCHII